MRDEPAINSRRPRVVMLGYSPEHPGGVTRATTSWLAAGLAERVELREIHTSRWDDPRPRQLLQALAALVTLVSLLVRRRADVVHMQLSTGGSLARKAVAGMFCRLFGVPYLVHIHSGDFENWVDRSPLAARPARRLITGAAVTIALAERWRPSFEALGARRVVVIPNGLDAAEREALGRVRQAPRPAAAADRPPVFLYYGRWTPGKGIDRVAEALRRIGGAGYEVRLFGSGDEEWLRAAFAGLEGDVHFGGWIDIDRKVEELACATALVVPSRVEGFGQVLLDARAAGVAVIASDCGAVGEVLEGHSPVALSECGDDAGLEAALAEVVARSWPPAGAASPPLPDRFRAESAVAALARLYDEIAASADR